MPVEPAVYLACPSCARRLEGAEACPSCNSTLPRSRPRLDLSRYGPKPFPKKRIILVAVCLGVWSLLFLGLVGWALLGKGLPAKATPVFIALAVSFEPGLVGLLRRKGYGWWAALFVLVPFSLFSAVKFLEDGWFFLTEGGPACVCETVAFAVRSACLAFTILPLVLLLSCRSSYYDFLERKGRTPTRLGTRDSGPGTRTTAAGSSPSGTGRPRGRTGGLRRSPRR